MKTIKRSLSVATYGILCSVLPVHAVVVTPPGPSAMPMPFIATGPATVSKAGIPISCNIVFTGSIDGGGKVLITSATFNGSSLCKTIKANASANAPWSGQVDSPAQLTIDNVMVSVNVPLVGGQCGPSKITAQIRDSDNETSVGLNNVNLSGDCGITGSLVTSPYMHIAP
ncbi:activator protein [Burkholderia sp. MS455]|uniref:activator protein n=1 Tax=Burkholderia sp. MS455 TaxID=2811788 RepID=UPI00195B8ACC|nr:activator protein [Burkholderia sp. MS455]QRR07591.1 activator protein [Burkholderia sp. MS455]